MGNTSINKKPGDSTYSSVLRGDYLFRGKSKGCLKETIQPLRQTPQLGAVLVVGITGCGVIVSDAHLERIPPSSPRPLSPFLNTYMCVFAFARLHLLLRAESLDVSGQFVRESDEQRAGDGLSVIWPAEL